MNLGAGAAGADFAHHPEIVFGSEALDVGGIDVGAFSPQLFRLFVSGQAFALVAAEDGGVKAFFGHAPALGQELPSPGYGFFLVIITEGPVSQHLKHGVVIGIVADLFQIVVLA